MTMTARRLKLGTRGSQLALWQARTVAERLARAGAAIEIVTIRTSGDRLQQAPLSDTGTKRLFVKEIEEALIDGSIDLAVHSAKDMPAVAPEGLAIAATLPREDPRDALVLPATPPAETGDILAALSHLRSHPSIGTSSVRRAAQLTAAIPGATFAPIRGNVDTRLRKLDAGDYDALVLAAAGLLRLGLAGRISAAFPLDLCVPAPGQGTVAIEIRADDSCARGWLGKIHDEATGVSLAAERALVAALGGGCQLPLGAVAIHRDGALDMHGVVTSFDGVSIRAHATGPVTDPEGLGRRVASELAAGGALDIFERAEARRSS